MSTQQLHPKKVRRCASRRAVRCCLHRLFPISSLLSPSFLIFSSRRACQGENSKRRREGKGLSAHGSSIPQLSLFVKMLFLQIKSIVPPAQRLL
jgi:hypothetical protein